MSFKKNYLKSKNICKVTFNFPANDADKVMLVGDFNNWNKNATPMKKSRSGFSTTVELEAGRDYQFRYLLDGQTWANDDDADSFTHTPFHDAQNGVIKI